jgi:hypothetical protein
METEFGGITGKKEHARKTRARMGEKYQSSLKGTG